MKLVLTDSAINLYLKEIPLQAGDKLRLYVRVGGIGSGGFSVGVMKDEPLSTSFKIEKRGIIFFVNEDDFWYLDGMTIDYNEDFGYLNFLNPAFEELHHPK
ncbi:hypothetical protein GN156_10950 [bacterium LRH843]|nr:hypothetical protein [bacterium LRH843]